MTNQPSLRDRIAEALRPGSRDRSGQYPEGLMRDVDAVLAVLPQVRAAALTEAADAVFALDYDELRDGYRFDSHRQAWELGTIDAANKLRGMTSMAAASEALATTCSAQYHSHGEPPRLCIRAARHTGRSHTDENGMHWSDTVAVYPVDDGTFRVGTDVRDALRRLAAEARPASTAPLAAGLPLVKGNCPACGGSLFLGNGGYVTCSRIDCREPDAASTVLERKAAEAHTTDTQDDVVVTVHAAPNLTLAAQEALGALVDVAKQQARCGFTHPHPDHPCGTPVDAAAPSVGSAEPGHDEAREVVHGCPPDGSGLTPCCGRTPFELPLTDRISSEAPVTCSGGPS